MDSLLGLLALIAGFGLIIFVHELGHFVVAKWVGIRVSQFAVGFGPSIVAWRKGIGFRAGTTEPEYQKRLANSGRPDAFGETEYRLNYVPFGGYIKMLGQDDIDPTAVSDDPRAYTAKPIWARMCVISAGVVMNLIFAMIFFVLAFSAGVAFPPAIVGQTISNFPAATTYAQGHENDPAYRGLRPGDHMTHINGKPTLDFTDLRVAAALGREDQSIDLTIDRSDEPAPLVYRITPKKLEGQLPALGIQPPISLTLGDDPKALGPVLTGAGVAPGMHIVAVNGQEVHRFDQYRDLVTDARDLPVEVTFANDDGSATATVPLRAVPLLTWSEKDEAHHLLGLVRAASIKAVNPRSPAERAGIQPGDMIVRINTIDWPTVPEVRAAVGESRRRPISLAIRRDEQIQQLAPVKTDREGQLGIWFGDEAVVADTLQDSPAAVLDLTPGSRILSINNQHVASFADIQRVVQDQLADASESTTLKITYQLNLVGDPTETRQVTLSAQDAGQLAEAGWAQPLVALLPLEVPLVSDNPIDAVKLGLLKTRETMVQTYVSLLRLVQGRVPLKELRGPIGIADIGTQIYRERGLTYLIYFLGLINVYLAVFNFLPIPITDGGHMVFLTIEKLKGSPVGPRIQTAATLVGLALIGCLFLILTYHDILRLSGLSN